MGVKILMDYNVLKNTMNRLNCCVTLLAQNADHALSAGDLKTDVKSVVAIGTLLNGISGDLFEEVKASVDAEEAARKRNRPRTAREAQG